MLLAGRDGNYSAPPPEKSMLGILRGARGDFPPLAILKEHLGVVSPATVVLDLRTCRFVCVCTCASAWVCARVHKSCSGIWGSCPLPLLSSNYGLVVLCACARVRLRVRGCARVCVRIVLNALENWHTRTRHPAWP